MVGCARQGTLNNFYFYAHFNKENSHSSTWKLDYSVSCFEEELLRSNSLFIFISFVLLSSIFVCFIKSLDILDTTKVYEEGKRLSKFLHDACDILKLVKMQSWGKLKCPFIVPSDKSDTGTEVDSASRVNQHKVSTPGLKSKSKLKKCSILRLQSTLGLILQIWESHRGTLRYQNLDMIYSLLTLHLELFTFHQIQLLTWSRCDLHWVRTLVLATRRVNGKSERGEIYNEI